MNDYSKFMEERYNLLAWAKSTKDSDKSERILKVARKLLERKRKSMRWDWLKNIFKGD